MGIKRSTEALKLFVQGSRFLILVSWFLVLFSCTPKTENLPPADLIEEKEMASVIADISLSEATFNSQPLAEFNDTLKRINVLREHNISTERFLSSFKYYTENPDKLKNVYAEVCTMLEDKPTVADSVKVP